MSELRASTVFSVGGSGTGFSTESIEANHGVLLKELV